MPLTTSAPLAALTLTAEALVSTSTTDDLYAATRQKIVEEFAALEAERLTVKAAFDNASARLNAIDERHRKLDYTYTNLADLMGALDVTATDSPK